eukprot:7273853-Ditylum_brightwellii.AAC.1
MKQARQGKNYVPVKMWQLWPLLQKNIDCPLNAINIRNVEAVKSTIEYVPGSQKVYMGPKAKAIEEQEQKILAIMKCSANTKRAANNNNKNKNNNVKHNIDGVQVTMIDLSVNNCEEEEASQNEDHLFMPDATL